MRSLLFVPVFYLFFPHKCPVDADLLRRFPARVCVSDSQTGAVRTGGEVCAPPLSDTLPRERLHGLDGTPALLRVARWFHSIIIPLGPSARPHTGPLLVSDGRSAARTPAFSRFSLTHLDYYFLSVL